MSSSGVFADCVKYSALGNGYLMSSAGTMGYFS